MTRAYYVLKPSIPGKVRLAVRRLRAERLSRRLSGVWYINETARTAPDGWPGWPDGKQFAFVLTHDVDSKRGFDRCLQVAEMDRRLGFPASFSCVPEGPYVGRASLRTSLAGKRFEIGVHDLRHDGKLYVSREGFTAGAQKINHYLAAWKSVGFRSAFMFHQLSWLRDLDIVYDASTFDIDPFEPQPDGANTIFPFWVSRDDGTGYVELPYTLPQDSTLFVLLRERSIETWKRKLEWVAEHGGMALVNVHPDYMNFDGRPASSEYGAHLYQDFLEYVRARYGRHAWFALPRDVAAYVRREGVLPRRRFHGLYCHNMPDVLVVSALFPKAQGAKVILDLHDPMPELMMSIFNLPHDSLRVRTLERLEKWSIRFADLALTVNLACKRLFVSRSCPPEKVQVVMNSPDEKIFGVRAPRPAPPPPRAPGQPFVIMYHGSLVERNGLQLAVDALARVRRSVPSAELRIYGPSSPFLERVMQSVRAPGLTSAVQYLGPIRLEDIVGAVEDCDVGVIPNQRSVFTEINPPTRILEYLAVRKPVIAPRAGGIRDYFDEESLIFFELGDVADLAQKIEYVFFHPAEAAEIAGRGQDVYRAHAWRAERQTLVNLAADLVSR